MKFLMNKQSILNAQNLGRVEPLEYHGGGGGGGTSTSTQGFPEEFKPYITKFLTEAEGANDRGDFNKVAGFTDVQREAQKQSGSAAGSQVALEKGLRNNWNTYDPGLEIGAFQDAQRNLGATNDMAGATGNVGGSRNRLNQMGVENDYTSALAGLRSQGRQQNFQNMGTALGAQGGGADRLASIGQQQQQQAQNQADAPWQGASRWASLLHGTLPKETTTTTTGGGK